MTFCRSQGREHNLLVVELKKNAAYDACDWFKLRLLTDPDRAYPYKLGLYIDVDAGRFTETWFKKGVPQPPEPIRAYE
jgi:hypothetical protein